MVFGASIHGHGFRELCQPLGDRFRCIIACDTGGGHHPIRALGLGQVAMRIVGKPLHHRRLFLLDPACFGMDFGKFFRELVDHDAGQFILVGITPADFGHGRVFDRDPEDLGRRVDFLK